MVNDTHTRRRSNNMIQNKIFSDSFGMLLQFVYVNMLFIVGNCDYCYALTYHAFYMLYHYM